MKLKPFAQMKAEALLAPDSLPKTKKAHVKGLSLRGNIWWLRFTRPDGTLHQESLKTADLPSAMALAAAIRASPDLTEGQGLREDFQRFVAYKKRMRKYTEHTARTKLNKLKLLAAFLPPRTTTPMVTTKQLQAWHDALLDGAEAEPLHPDTVVGYLMAAQAFFRWAVEVEHLRRDNPTQGVEVVSPVGRARKDYCGYELRDRLLAEAEDEELRFILFCGLHAGMRFNEIVEARPFWFDLDRGQIHMRMTPTMNFKGKEERTVPMTREFREFLRAYGLRAPFMIQPEKKKGKWLYRYDFRAKFMTFMEKLGCDGTGEHPRVTPHTMRHTFAALLVSAGESIYKVAVWMGDEVSMIQKHYGHLAPDDGGIEKAFSERGHSPPGHSPADRRSQA